MPWTASTASGIVTPSKAWSGVAPSAVAERTNSSSVAPGQACEAAVDECLRPTAEREQRGDAERSEVDQQRPDRERVLAGVARQLPRQVRLAEHGVVQQRQAGEHHGERGGPQRGTAAEHPQQQLGADQDEEEQLAVPRVQQRRRRAEHARPDRHPAALPRRGRGGRARRRSPRVRSARTCTPSERNTGVQVPERRERAVGDGERGEEQAERERDPALPAIRQARVGRRRGRRRRSRRRPPASTPAGRSSLGHRAA